VAYEDNSLREAADHMLRENIGRLPVVKREAPRIPVGMLTRSDILAAHHRRLNAVQLNPGIALHGTGLLHRRKKP
jgi:signal-transduction protein with cAMP-binding, CBS, and nucleotidyltransferase domain